MRARIRGWVAGTALQVALAACSADQGTSSESGSRTTGSNGSVGSTASSVEAGVAGSTASATDWNAAGPGSRSGGTPSETSSKASGEVDGGTTALDASEAIVDGTVGVAQPDVGSAVDGGIGAATDADDAAAADGAAGWDSLPALLARIVPPTFNAMDCDVTRYGGVGDDSTDNTTAFTKAIYSCAQAGGGRVVVPAGTFLTGPIDLLSNINLYVSAGATIKFTTDPAKYLPVVKVSWEGSLAYNYHPLIYAHDAINVAITGPGTIDGSASSSNWYAWKGQQSSDQTNLRNQNAMNVPIADRVYGDGHYLRPDLIELMNCKNVLLDGFTAKNSPFWTIHPVFSQNVTARGFHSVGSAPNTDGFDPESCTDVLIENCTIDVGDDAIAIKAGRDHDGWTYYTPTENVVIQGCAIHSKHGGVAIGSEMSAGVRAVYVQDTKFAVDTGSLIDALEMKSATTRGGFIEDFFARSITVGSVDVFLNITGHYVSGAVVGPISYTTIANINVDGATVAGTNSSPFFIAGADATKIATGIHLSNITVDSATTPALASGSGHYADLTTTNVVVNGNAFTPPTGAP